VEKEGRNVCELFPAESSPLGIVPIVSAREVAFNLEGGSFHIFTDALTEGCREDGGEPGVKSLSWRRSRGTWIYKPLRRRVKPGWRRQKATSRFWRPQTADKPRHMSDIVALVEKAEPAPRKEIQTDPLPGVDFSCGTVEHAL